MNVAASFARASIVALGLFGIADDQAIAGPVYVDVPVAQGQSVTGQGISVLKGADCLIVTPSHVVRDHSGLRPITVNDVNGTKTTVDAVIAEVAIAEIEDDGLTVMRLKPEAGFLCSTDWSDGAGTAAAVLASPYLRIERVKQGGGLSNIKATRRDETTGLLLLDPRVLNLDEVREKDSGSPVYDEGGKLVGMIVNVNPATRVSTAVRQDHVHALLKSVVLTDAKVKVLVHPLISGRGLAARTDALALLEALKSDPDYITAELPSPARAPAWPLQVSKLALSEHGDYILAVKILRVSSSRRENPAYTQEVQQLARSNELAKQLGGALKLPGAPKLLSGGAAKPTAPRYMVDYVIEVEFLLATPDGRTSHTHSARREVPLLADKARAALDSLAIAEALRWELPVLMAKAGL